MRSLVITLMVVLAFVSFVHGQVPSRPGEWPQWRGPNRDGISGEKGLLREWPEGGPTVLWTVDTVGTGYSSIAVKDGRIFTQGDLDGVEHILALDAKTGETLWAVQPGPVAQLLAQRLENELKQLDRDGNGQVDEIEGLARFGFDLNKYDKRIGGDAREIAESRAAKLFAILDKNSDQRLSFDEAGGLLRDEFQRADSEDKTVDAIELAERRANSLINASDADSNGRVTRQESRGSLLDRLFGRIDQRNPATNTSDDELTRDEIVSYFAKDEKGRDGELTLGELEDLYASRNLTGDGVLTADELKGAFGGFGMAWATDRAVHQRSMATASTSKAATATSLAWKPRRARRFGTSTCETTSTAEFLAGVTPNPR